MASIGAVTCSFVKGEAPLPKQRVALWQVPGLNGYGAQRMGLGDSEFRFVAVFYGTRNNVVAWANAIQALQGTLQTVINDWGGYYYRCLIVRTSPPQITMAYHAGGARGEILIEGVVA
ncbi:MAG: hypothetical protein WC107_06260 [Patescibacteria group bacterium]|jgi:hypothetical protein